MRDLWWRITTSLRNFWREINALLARFMTPAVRGIFLANLIVFVVGMLTMPLSTTMQSVFLLLAETPADAVGHFYIWQFFTYMFLHAGVGHLLMNMLMLWFFAPRLEQRWGFRAFLRFYFVVGMGAGLCHALVAYVAAGGANVMNPMIGASGAIYGILLAYALYYPNDTVLLYFVIPIRVKYFMIILGVFTLLSSYQSAVIPGGGADHISHITHLGGIVVALLYLKIGDLRRRGPRRVDPRSHPDFWR